MRKGWTDSSSAASTAAACGSLGEVSMAPPPLAVAKEVPATLAGLAAARGHRRPPPSLLIEAGLESFHQVHDLAFPPSLRPGGRDVLALDLLLDQLLDALAHLVFVLAGLERVGGDLL